MDTVRCGNTRATLVQHWWRETMIAVEVTIIHSQLESMVLERMEMENFKSFRGKHEIKFSSGFNCITGPNGSGKSNILEAICFALGEGSTNRLRVKSLKDLQSNASTNDTNRTSKTRVTLHLRTRQKQTFVLTASICPQTGHRIYKLNNRLTPLKYLKRQLRIACGINIDVSLWLIQQNLVHKMPSKTPMELASYLCEAGGTKVFLDQREEAESAVRNFKDSADRISKNIETLRDLVKEGASVLELMREHRQTQNQVKALELVDKKLKLSLLALECRDAEDKENQVKELESQDLAIVEELARDITVAESKVDEVETQLKSFEGVEKDARNCQQELLAVDSEMKETSARIQATEDAIAHKSSQCSTYAKDLKALDEKIQQIQKDEAHYSALQWSTNLLSQCRKERREKPSRSRLLQFISDQFERVKEDSQDKSGESIRGMLDMTVKEINRLESGLRRMTTTIQEMTAEIKQLEVQRHDTMRSCVGWTASQAAIDMARLIASTIELQSRVRRSNASLPQPFPTIQGDGDYGLLLHLFSIKPNDLQSKWTRPLSILLQKHLCNRICRDLSTAKQILAVNRNQRALTIWPVQELRVPPRRIDRFFSSIQQQFGNHKVCDPMSLLVVSQTGMETGILHCLRKALGSWLLVEDDQVAKAILKKYGIPSVTLSLNVHSKGTLSGGQTETSPLYSRFLSFQTLEHEMQRVEYDRNKVEHVLESFERLHRLDFELRQLSEKCATINKEKTTLEDDLEHLNDTRKMYEQELSATHDSELKRRARLQEMEQIREIINRATNIETILDQRNRDQASTEKSLESIRTKYHEAENEIARVQALLKCVKDEIDELNTRIQEDKAEQKSLEQKLIHAKAAQEMVAKQLAQYQELKATTDRLLASLSGQRARRTETENRLTSYEATMRNLRTSINGKLQAMNEIHGEEIQDYHDYIPKEHTIDELKRLLKQNKKQRDDATLEASVLQEKLSMLPPIDEEDILHKQQKLSRFAALATNIQVAIKNLEDGIRSTEQRTVEANELTFTQVRDHFRRIFASAVPQKQADLVPTAERIELGVAFDVKMGRSTKTHESTNVRELSGGQLTMLGMAYIFALACSSSSPIYILDEIDAALDGHNQRIVAELILEKFSRSQVFCISHHEVFHSKANCVIRVEKDNAVSRIAGIARK